MPGRLPCISTSQPVGIACTEDVCWNPRLTAALRIKNFMCRAQRPLHGRRRPRADVLRRRPEARDGPRSRGGERENGRERGKGIRRNLELYSDRDLAPRG